MSNIPAKVSKWEIAGVPVATILLVLNEMETIPAAVQADLPRYMFLLYIIAAVIRSMHQTTQDQAAAPKTE